VTRSIRGSRRAAVLAGTAAAASLLMSGCGAGQIAETAAMKPTVSGVNAQTADNAFKIRNVSVAYLSTSGYTAGSDAPVEGAIYNDSGSPVTVKVTTDSARAVILVSGSAGAIRPTRSPSASASPAPTGTASSPESDRTEAAPASPGASPSATPQGPAGAAASMQISAGGFVILSRAAGTYLQLVGLNADLPPGHEVNLIFTFDGTELRTSVPVALPLTPGPAATPIVQTGGGAHGG
jgi:hypothetical protein